MAKELAPPNIISHAAAELGPCICWTGLRTAAGYGWIKGRGSDLHLAHRVAYCDANGLELADIDGLVVRHRCDNPPCFHPGHLVIGTQAENMMDMKARGRARGPSLKGERNPASKLNKEKASEIRALYVKGSREFGCSALGRMFGVDQSQIHHIVTGRHWPDAGGTNAA